MTPSSISGKISFAYQNGKGSTKWKLVVNTILLSIYARIPFVYRKVCRSQKTQLYHFSCLSNSYVVRLRLQDLPMFYEIFYDRTYQLPKSWQISDLPFLDFGAHVGLTTIFIAKTYQLTAPIICIEASKANFAILKENLALNQIDCQLLNMAVSATSGTVFFSESEIGYNHKIAENHRGHEIGSISPKDVFQKYGLSRIGLLKMDIEGTEKELLADASMWLPKVQRLIIELHGDFDYQAFSSVIEPLNFTTYDKNTCQNNKMVLAIQSE